MSWSVSAMGKGVAVEYVISEQFGKMGKMIEPEQAMADGALEIIRAACNGAPDSGLIVRADGSQYTDSSVGNPESGKVKGMHFKLEIDLIQLAG